MKTITSKTAKNGAQLWYVDGKRTSRDKAVEADIANGREKLSNLLANLTVDGDTEFAIYVEFNLEIGGRCHAFFNFTDADKAVEAARKIVALGNEQIARVVIDNDRPYPANVRYADTVDGKLIFLNGFERFNETEEVNNIDGYDESAFDLLPTVDELNDVEIDDEAKTDEPTTESVNSETETVNLDGITETDDAAEIENAAAAGTEAETVKFEVGKSYVNVRKSVLFGSQFTITVIKRSDKFVTFQFDEDEEDIRRRKVVDEYGVEKIYIHETNALDGDYEFSANDVVDEAKAAEVNAPAEAKADETVTDDENIAAEVNAFDKAVKDSIENYGASLEVNGETLTFEDGQVTQVASTRYGAYFTIRNGRKNFFYRGNRVSKQEFFGHIETEDKALAQRAAIGEFVGKFGGSEIKPGLNPQGKFVAQLHPTLANGRQDNYFATFDSKDDAHAFIAEFKKLAPDMKFMATIKRGSFHGEVIYRHGLKGQEFFATDEPEITDETDGDAPAMTEKIEVAIGADAVPAMIDLFEPNKITLNTPAQILKLIEDAAGNSFSFDYESYFINTDDDTRHKFITRHFVSECKNYSFIEIFTDDGKLDCVEFLKHFLAGYKEVKFYLAAPAQGNESQDDDTDKYFELADELDEIGGDICNTKDILERKIANGAPQTEIKSLEGYIDEREGEYRALHKRIYGVEPQADNKVYPIDIAIYHGGSALTEAELEDTAAVMKSTHFERR